MEALVYISRVRMVSQEGYHMAYIAEAREPVVYASTAAPGPYKDEGSSMPVISPLDHLVSATATCLYGTLGGALQGRKVPFDHAAFTATAEGYIVRAGGAIRVASIAVHYELMIAPAFRNAAMRALQFHTRGCPVHLSLKDAIVVTWDATLHVGDEIEEVKG